MEGEHTFYIVFTGNAGLPENVHTFSLPLSGFVVFAPMTEVKEFFNVYSTLTATGIYANYISEKFSLYSNLTAVGKTIYGPSVRFEVYSNMMLTTNTILLGYTNFNVYSQLMANGEAIKGETI